MLPFPSARSACISTTLPIQYQWKLGPNMLLSRGIPLNASVSSNNEPLVTILQIQQILLDQVFPAHSGDNGKGEDPHLLILSF